MFDPGDNVDEEILWDDREAEIEQVGYGDD